MTITRAELLRAFEAEGISIREWALTRGYCPMTVYRVIWGKSTCKRGLSHKIAVELGLKEAPKKPRLRKASTRDKAA